jgi:Cu-Zn family superoxide dismutase
MRRFERPALLISAALGLALGACDRAAEPEANKVSRAAAAEPATIPLKGPGGEAMGEVTVSEDPTGVTLRIAASGLSPGAHGVHLHSVGMCDGAKFESAGPHWNPTGKQHGRDNPAGAHSGDLANLMVGADGSGSSLLLVAGARLGEGAATLADADGTALVIHAKPDDYKTDPSGASGDRVACAVVAAK